MYDSPSSLREITSLWVPGGVWSQVWNLKELTEGHHRVWSLRLNLTQHGKTYQVQTLWGLTDLRALSSFNEWWCMAFLVGGVICLVNSVNERDLNLLNSNWKTSTKTHWCLAWSFDGAWRISVWMTSRIHFLEGLSVLKQMEVWGNNRSVMPLDVLGRTRATLISSTSLTPWPVGLGNLWKTYRDGDRWL